MANERYELFDLIKETFIRLGEADFEDWWHRQTPELFDAITQAITDPAFKLRPAQRMPEGRWRTWMIRTGRGWGKTQAGSTAVHDCAVDLYPGGNGILVGATVKDVRDTMIEGDSGLLATARPGHPCIYNKHDLSVTWPTTGSKAIIRTADNPEDIRGPTLNWGWADEVVKWRSEKSWDNLNRCVRNKHPVHGARIIVTTTPLRAKQWIKDIEDTVGCVVTKGSTLENTELDDSFLESACADINSVRGREEVLGEWVEGVGQLWTDTLLNSCRIKAGVNLAAMIATMQRVVLSVDPSSGMKDECGIVLVGRKAGRAYVLADWSFKGNINEWTDVVVQKAGEYLRPGDLVLLETNNNAAAKNVLEMKNCPVRIEPVFQKESKYERAEIAFSHFIAERVSILGTWSKLETQLKEWEAQMKDSPDRGDAMTQGVNFLLGKRGTPLSGGLFNLGGLSF